MKIMRYIINVFFTLIISLPLFPQEAEKTMRSIFDEALSDKTAFSQLEYLCKNTKGRIPGSSAAAKAVEYTRQSLIKQEPIVYGFKRCRFLTGNVVLKSAG